MRPTAVAASLLILLSLTSCAPRAPQEPEAPDSAPTVDPVDEVLRFRDGHVTALVDSRDMDRIVGHYTDDAVYAPPGEPAVTGQAAIRAYLEEFFSRSLFGVRFDNHTALVDGDLAVLRDSYSVVLLPRSGPQSQHSGEDVWVLRRIDGTWKVASILWTRHAAAE